MGLIDKANHTEEIMREGIQCNTLDVAIDCGMSMLFAKKNVSFGSSVLRC